MRPIVRSACASHASVAPKGASLPWSITGALPARSALHPLSATAPNDPAVTDLGPGGETRSGERRFRLRITDRTAQDGLRNPGAGRSFVQGKNWRVGISSGFGQTPETNVSGHRG